MFNGPLRLIGVLKRGFTCLEWWCQEVKPRQCHGEAFYDVVVIGGGFTGLQIASCLTSYGLKVALVEGDSSIGGHYALLTRYSGLFKELEGRIWGNVDVYVGSPVKAIEGNRIVGNGLRLGFRYAVIATGFREVPLVFVGNGEVPQVTATSLLKLVKSGEANVKRILVWGFDDWCHDVIDEFIREGVEVVQCTSRLTAKPHPNAEGYRGVVIESVKRGRNGVRVKLRRLKSCKRGKSEVEVRVDAIVSAIREPNSELAMRLKTRHVYKPWLGGLVPVRDLDGLIYNDVFITGHAASLLPLNIVELEVKAVVAGIAFREGRMSREEYEARIKDFLNGLRAYNPAIADSIEEMSKSLREGKGLEEPNVIDVPSLASAGCMEDLEDVLRNSDEVLLCPCRGVRLSDALRLIEGLTGVEVKTRYPHGFEAIMRNLKAPDIAVFRDRLGLGLNCGLCLIQSGLIIAFILQKKASDILHVLYT